MSSSILSSITFVYGLAVLLYVIAWIFRQSLVGRLATGVTLIGAVGNLTGLGLRWVESYQLGYGHAPLSNMYESLVFFAGVFSVLYLIVERRTENRIIGVFASPLFFLAMAYASLSPGISDQIQPLIPALKSNWLIAHVISCFIGYAAFGIAFGLAWMFLLKAFESEGRGNILRLLPGPDMLDELTHQMIMLGFFFLSIGIITGAVWANSAWGRYWGWDPKETWSLVTWFIYAGLLHARLMRGWQGRAIAWFSIAGFAAVLFTWFGVNYLPGLHSYGAQ